MRQKFWVCVLAGVAAISVGGVIVPATPASAASADTVVATIPVGKSPYGVAINPAGTFAYITNASSNTASKIDLTTDTVVATIPVGKYPTYVAINPAGTFVYITNNDSGTVSKINLATDTVVATIQVGTWPYGVAINPAGTFAYITNSGSGTVSKINLATDTVVAAITVGVGPRGVAINPAGTFAYITNSVSSTVSKINLATDTVVATFRLSSEPRGVAINPAGTFAYITDSNNGRVSKISLATDTVVATIQLGSYPSDVTINPAGTFAYISNSGRVSKIDLATDTVVATITVGYGPTGVAINPVGTFAYIPNYNSGTVSKISLTVSTSSLPSGLAKPGGVTDPSTTTRPQKNLRFTSNPYLPESLKSGSRPVQCPQVMILGFRGSGERPAAYIFEDPKTLLKSGQRYLNWSDRTGYKVQQRMSASNFLGAVPSGWYNELFGTSVGQHVEQLRLMVAKKRGIKVSDVGIWSVGVDDVQLTDVWKNNIPQPIYQAGGVRYSILRINSNLGHYLESIVTDSFMLNSKHLFERYVSEICPEVSEIYAVGYSQGAIFARQAIAEVVAASPSKARGLLLLADPLFRYKTEKCCLDYIYALNHVWNNEDADGLGHVQDKLIVGPSLASTLELPQLDILVKTLKVLTVCVNRDLVCDFSVKGMALRAKIHSDSYRTPKSSLAFIQMRVSKLIN